MGLLQAAYRTYQAQAHRAGIAYETEREALTPVSHMLQNAQIEISISVDGIFQSANKVSKDDNKTMIPATTQSGSRSGLLIAPHPLCDQLLYLSPHGGDKHMAYLQQLRQWAQSAHSHAKVRAVLRYVEQGNILTDLAAVGLIELDKNGLPSAGKIEATAYEKCMVRWRILPAPDGCSTATWQDQSLFDCYAAYYHILCCDHARDICLITGREDTVCESHPKGTVSAYFGAKLISANDSAGYTYRGRFTQARQAGSVGYDASQKAHHALRFIAANHGMIVGGRTFLCWNPEGIAVPSYALLDMPDTSAPDFAGYQRELKKTLGGSRQALLAEQDVVIAALDAATTGRLSVTYYHELKGSDFLDRVTSWYETLCWDYGQWGIRAPSVRRIVNCAFGTERTQFIETDERLMRQHVQQLVHCIVDKQALPQDMVRALAVRAGTPLAFSNGNRAQVLSTACAAIRKYHNDRKQKEEWKLALDTTNTDRSYLFGRLLAVAEQVERSTYKHDEGREPNAIRMQAMFSSRPLYAWRIISEQLNPYFAHLQPGLRSYFKNIIAEITDKLGTKDAMLGSKLEDVYLLGYYHQRSALTQKKTSTREETDHEYAAE